MPIQFEITPPFSRTLIDPLRPSLKVGAATGGAGLIYGGIRGIVQAYRPALVSAHYGLHFFGVGSLFWYARSALLETVKKDEPSEVQKLSCSAAAGCISGGINGALLSRAYIRPAFIFMGLMGFSGQYISGSLAKLKFPKDFSVESVLRTITDLKWVPVTMINDDQHADILSEQLVQVEARISLIDDKIAALKAAGANMPPDAASAQGEAQAPGMRNPR